MGVQVSSTFGYAEVGQISSDRLKQSVFRLWRNRQYLHPTPKTALRRLSFWWMEALDSPNFSHCEKLQHPLQIEPRRRRENSSCNGWEFKSSFGLHRPQQPLRVACGAPPPLAQGRLFRGVEDVAPTTPIVTGHVSARPASHRRSANAENHRRGRAVVFFFCYQRWAGIRPRRRWCCSPPAGG